MFALLGLRFHVMAELYKIRKRINQLLDRYNATDDEHTKNAVREMLDKERIKLENWKQEHGYG